MSSVCGERDCARHTSSIGYGQGTWRGHIHTIFGLCWAFFNTHTRRYGIAIGRGLAQGARRGHVLVASPLRPSCAAVPPPKETNAVLALVSNTFLSHDGGTACPPPIYVGSHSLPERAVPHRCRASRRASGVARAATGSSSSKKLHLQRSYVIVDREAVPARVRPSSDHLGRARIHSSLLGPSEALLPTPEHTRSTHTHTHTRTHTRTHSLPVSSFHHTAQF